jgi:hypothetical protein
MAKRIGASDEGNASFSFGRKNADHKPGVDMTSHPREAEGSTDHQFKRSDEKAIPKGTLAERFAKKGG